MSLLTNEFVWNETLQGLETAAEIVGGNEVCEALADLVMRFVIEVFEIGVLNRAVHPLYLTVRPRWVIFVKWCCMSFL